MNTDEKDGSILDVSTSVPLSTLTNPCQRQVNPDAHRGKRRMRNDNYFQYRSTDTIIKRKWRYFDAFLGHSFDGNMEYEKSAVSTGRKRDTFRKLYAVMLLAPILSIIGIFVLASIRERDMDQHHSFHYKHYRIRNQTESQHIKSLDNGWIPKNDVIQHSNIIELESSMETKELDKNKNFHTKKHITNLYQYRYQPSLHTYPISLLKNLTEPISSTDVIFQFHIPKAAGTLTKQILTRCYHLSHPLMYNRIDISTIAGISQAKANRLVASRDILDVITSSHLHEGCTLLSSIHQGRLFVMFRHPVEREVSLFYYLGKAVWEDGYREDFRNMTLLEYATFDDHDHEHKRVRIDNWMVRYLARRLKGDILPQDLQLAKDILRYKSLIGLTSDYQESMRRFDLFYGIRFNEGDSGIVNGLRGRPDQGDCVVEQMRERVNENLHDPISIDSPEWNALKNANSFDMELYSFAKTLYAEQGKMFVEDGGSVNINMKNRRWNFRSPT